jgi:hypothetical protein
MIALTCQECGVEIQVKYPAQAKTRLGGRRRFCSDQCSREHRGKLYVRACGERGLLPVAQVAQFFGVTEHRVGDYRKLGALPATEIMVAGMLRANYGYALVDVQQFKASRILGKPGPASAEPTLAAVGEIGAELAAAYCHISSGVLHARRRAGKVKATEHHVPGIWRPVFGFKPADLDAFKRAEATRLDPWHRRNLDPEFAAKMSRGRGGDGVTAAQRARARATDLARRKGGRPRGDERASRWRVLLDEMRELADQFEERAGDLELCKAVALEDYPQHPEEWSYDPESDPDRAARRVNAAVKRRHKMPANSVSQNG